MAGDGGERIPVDSVYLSSGLLFPVECIVIARSAQWEASCLWDNFLMILAKCKLPGFSLVAPTSLTVASVTHTHCLQAAFNALPSLPGFVLLRGFRHHLLLSFSTDLDKSGEQ